MPCDGFRGRIIVRNRTIQTLNEILLPDSCFEKLCFVLYSVENVLHYLSYIIFNEKKAQGMKLFGRLPVTIATLALFVSGGAVQADDAEAQKYYEEGIAELEANDYTSAADLFLDAEFAADSPHLKANAVTKAVEAYRAAGLYYKEFENIEKLLDSYAAYSDYASLIDREYEIGDEYYNGHRDPAFYSSRFIPWLKESNRTTEICEKVLERAPYTPQAPQRWLRLAVANIEKGDLQSACDQLRKLIKEYPDAPERKLALLRLGATLYAMAEHGDGDGAFSREAETVFETFNREFPEATERESVQKMHLRVRENEAKRLFTTAEYYRRHERLNAAEAYLAQILREYPDTRQVNDAEELLTELDPTFVPERYMTEVPDTEYNFPVYQIPEEQGELLITPEGSDGKYLLPIRALNLPRNTVKQAPPDEEEAVESVDTAEKETEK